MSLTRRFWVVAHRWAGLTLAIFLTIAGITGALLPFEESLNYATRPSLSRAVPPHPGAQPLDAVTIAERVERATGGRIAYLPLEVPRNHAMRMFIAAAPHGPALPYDVVWADPYSGVARLTYTWGGVRDGPENIMPFLYQLHYGYVAGPWGMITFGIAALIWTLDCFVGFGLTLPVPQRTALRSPLAGWWRRWKLAWTVRRHVRGHKLNFDLHRATGLWLWPLLLVFAWSGVALTLPQVERPVMQIFGASDRYVPPQRPQPLADPPIDRREAIAIGLRELRTIGMRRSFTVSQPAMLGYDAGSGAYALYTRTSLDAVHAGGRTILWLDAASGHPLHWDDPIGRTGADRLETWFEMLHMADVFGLPYRIFVSTLGLAVTTLSVTGVLIWLKKRSARLAASARGRRLTPQARPKVAA
ncbi:PepSY domain-containing protein [Sphingomonas sp. CGMCC 1.13654]|uniref:PepSY domain-containing protein n=1 Tax=Sphingomonas chungangi TaxID=2683589 RepID=A0A838L2K2_9SPHN|nr:PepSY-associated TM helix domain-containing protein [Sphingomonas chungangi]MBA2933160.1 PepSY domain-containing protein [Sphingomonas chungangi]MVW57832.1 hypothetical protein [Sphingomonas chungangi]